MKVKPIFLLIPLLLAFLTSCYEPEDRRTSRAISGRLLKSCDDATAVAGMELEFRYRTSVFVEDPVFTTTDQDGNFEFNFLAEDWHDGGRYSNWGEIYEAENDRLIIDGVKPGQTVLEDIYYEYDRTTPVIFSVNLNKLIAGDSLFLKSYPSEISYRPLNTVVTDTFQCHVRGKESGGLSAFDYTTRITWLIYNSDSLRKHGIHFAELTNPCQDSVITEISFE